MKSESISEDGSQVDYKKIKKSKLFKEYCDIAVSLRLVDLDTLNEKQKIAFFISILDLQMTLFNLDPESRMTSTSIMLRKPQAAISEFGHAKPEFL